MINESSAKIGKKHAIGIQHIKKNEVVDYGYKSMVKKTTYDLILKEGYVFRGFREKNTMTDLKSLVELNKWVRMVEPKWTPENFGN